MIQEKVIYPEMVPRGEIKIELFDELTGKKVDEANTHNFISKAVGNYLYRLAIKGLFTRNKASGGRDVYGDIKDVFRTLVLTDASHPEDPDNEWLLKGKEIGYAHTHETYSGSDVLRGTYNTKESYTNLERVHMVFDFPSHAGNGVFQSLYFIGESEILMQNWQSTLPLYFNRPLQYNIAGKYHNGLIYVLGTDTSSTGSAGSGSSNKLRVFDKQFNLLNEYNLPSSFEDFEIVVDKIYFARNSSSQPIHVADLNNPVATTPVSVSLPNNYNARGIVWDGSKFIVSSGIGSAHQITELDSDFNVINNKEISGLSTGSAKLRLEEGQLLITTYDYTGRTRRLYSDYSLSNFYAPDLLCVFDDKMLLNSGYVMPKMNIASRALLDAPVTKTDQYTMKITYDFVLDIATEG